MRYVRTLIFVSIRPARWPGARPERPRWPSIAFDMLRPLRKGGVEGFDNIDYRFAEKVFAIETHLYGVRPVLDGIAPSTSGDYGVFPKLF